MKICETRFVVGDGFFEHTRHELALLWVPPRLPPRDSNWLSQATTTTAVSA